MKYSFLTNSVETCSVLGIVLNIFLMYVVYRFSAKMGLYKFLFLFFGLIEVVYATVVFVTLPVFYVHDYRQVIFSYSSFLAESEYSTVAAGLYCTIFELWVGFVVIMYAYRYILLCHDSLHKRIHHSVIFQLIILVFYMITVIYSIMCGLVWCTMNKVPQNVKDAIKEEFGFNSTDHLGYMVASLKKEDGSFSVSGTLSVANHIILCSTSAVIIIYCGRRIWMRICEMGCDTNEYKKNMQIFYTLIIQAVIPLLSYQIPIVFVLGYTVTGSDNWFGQLIPYMSLILTIPKILDPLCIIFIIREYRNGVKRMFTGTKIQTETTITSTTGRYLA